MFCRLKTFLYLCVNKRGRGYRPGRVTGTVKTHKAMTKNYYRSEYEPRAWEALIDKAHELGCVVTFSKYGNIAEIDSTDKENALLAGGTGDREFWADNIHRMIEEASRIKWAVFAKGCPVARSWFKSRERAEEYARECEHYEKIAHEVRGIY